MVLTLRAVKIVHYDVGVASCHTTPFPLDVGIVQSIRVRRLYVQSSQSSPLISGYTRSRPLEAEIAGLRVPAGSTGN